ncbi:MAG: proton-conducting transporter membrane subunit, partial [Cytophagales bacterium]
MNVLVFLSLGVVLFPFFVLLLYTITRSKSSLFPWFAIGIQAITFTISIYLFISIFGYTPVNQSFDWLKLTEGISFSFGLYLDDHSVLMLLVVQLVSLLVHIYSFVYFEGETSRNRFFGFLGLFICAMNGLVLADNLLMLFVFWELVGFASYLLIGFWFDRDGAVAASKKAFIINRIADLGFMAAIVIFWSQYDTLNIHQLKYVIFHFHESFAWLHIAGFGLFLACMGKSAQFPFQIWLPDAMEG